MTLSHHHMKGLLLAAMVGLAVPSSAFAAAVTTNGKTPLPVPPANAALLELVRDIDALKREVQALRGQIEDRGHEIEQLRNQVTDLERRGKSGPTDAPLETLNTPAGGAVAGTPSPEHGLQVQTQAPADAPEGFEPDPAFTPPPRQPPPQAAQTPPAAPPPAKATDDTASEASYREAFGLLRTVDYDKAIAGFSAFLTRYPNSQYSDSAQYWLAEALMANGSFDKAVPEYQKLLTQYPASKKLPYAMLKMGDCYDKLGKAKEAKSIWGELRKQFPGSAPAKLAEQRPGVSATPR